MTPTVVLCLGQTEVLDVRSGGEESYLQRTIKEGLFLREDFRCRGELTDDVLSLIYKVCLEFKLYRV